MNISYEGFYVQEAQKSIENKMVEKVENIGINEMANKIINSVVDTTSKKRQTKEKQERLLKELKIENDNLTKESNHKLKKKKSYNKKVSLKNNMTNIIDNNLNIKEKMSDKSLNNFKENDKTLYQQYIQDKNIDKNNNKA